MWESRVSELVSHWAEVAPRPGGGAGTDRGDVGFIVAPAQRKDGLGDDGVGAGGAGGHGDETRERDFVDDGKADRLLQTWRAKFFVNIQNYGSRRDMMQTYNAEGYKPPN